VKEALVCSTQIEYSFNLYFFLFSPQRLRGPEGGPEGGSKKETRREIQKRGPGYMSVYIPKTPRGTLLILKPVLLD